MDVPQEESVQEVQETTEVINTSDKLSSSKSIALKEFSLVSSVLFIFTRFECSFHLHSF